jgi:hypothetical protein
MSSSVRRSLSVPFAVVIAVAVAACGAERAAGPASVETGVSADAMTRVALCHFSGDHAQEITVSSAALAAHAGHGDYVTLLHVSPDAVEDGRTRFRRIGDAVAAATATREARGERTAGACRITIEVAAGSYRAVYGTSADPAVEALPLVLEVPDVTLRGAYRPIIDAEGRATDQGQTHAVTTIVPDVGLLTTSDRLSQPILMINGRSDGYAAHRTEIEGFAFRSGNGSSGSGGGAAIITLRVDDIRIEGNRFEGGFSESVDLRASTGRVVRNHLAGGAGTCDICLAGPGRYVAEGNRLLAGGIPGIITVPTLFLPAPAGIEPYQLPATARVEALLLNNEIRDHQRIPVGTGLRVGAVGVGAPNVIGYARVEARDNLLVNNRFGMLIEAAFPVAGTARRGDLEVILSGNRFVSSCQAPLAISLSRHTTGLGLANAPYLLNSSYVVSLGGDLAWDDVWYAHPAGFGNTLVVDGATIPNGLRHQYDAAKSCS